MVFYIENDVNKLNLYGTLDIYDVHYIVWDRETVCRLIYYTLLNELKPIY